jgi:hypothetical protein
MTEHKTAGKFGSKSALPVVGHAYGISGAQWASGLISLRKELKLEDSSGLLTVPRGDGCGFTAKPMSGAEASIWLQELLVAGGFAAESVADLTTHSLRTTMLSWCAKFGVREGSRRILGYHSKPKDIMMLEYSRDALSGPLGALGEVLDCITNGSFDPDSSRSGYKRAKVGARASLVLGPASSSSLVPANVEDMVSPPPTPPLPSSPPVRGFADDFTDRELNQASGTIVYAGPKSSSRGLHESDLLLGLRRPMKGSGEFLNEYESLARKQFGKHELLSLGGKTLVCSCPVNVKCHVDVLINLVNEAARGPLVPEKSSSEDAPLSQEDSSTEHSARDMSMFVENSREKVIAVTCVPAKGTSNSSHLCPRAGFGST